MYALHTFTTPWGPVENLLRVSDGAVIPADEENVDYRAYLAWVAEGNEPEVEAG